MIAFYSSGQSGTAFLMLIFLAIMCFYFYVVRHRIPFATAVLDASATALRAHSGPIWVTLGMSLGIGSVEMTLGLGVSAGDDEERDIFADPDQVAEFHYRSMRVLLGLEASL